jgi:hypothetical protein
VSKDTQLIYITQEDGHWWILSPAKEVDQEQWDKALHAISYDSGKTVKTEYKKDRRVHTWKVIA